MLLCGSVSAHAQAPTVVRGTVTSATGALLDGATISVDSSRIGGMTDDKGRYRIVLPPRYRGTVRLSARRFGYRAQNKVVSITGAEVVADFTLEAQATQLTGMIVSAMSVRREKASLGTSQQEISSLALKETRTPNLVNAMAGKISGVTIQSSGNMGGSTRLIIRGPTSILGNNQPLFIVDGVPVSNAGFSAATAGGGTATSNRDFGSAIADLNPDDIATYTVLKGPNAAALYGSRASNGVVVITTKSGASGGTGVKWTYESYVTRDQFSVLPSYQNRYGQGFGGEFKYVDGAGGGINDGADESWGPKLDGRLIDQYNGKALPWVARPNNVRDFFQTGQTISNNLSVVASNEKMGARLAIGRENTRGIVPNAGLAKLTATVSANAAVSDHVTANGSLQYVKNEGFNRPEVGYIEGNPFQGFTWFGRQVDTKPLKHKYFNADGSLFNWNSNYHTNPYWSQYANSQYDVRDRLIAQGNVALTLTPWLKGTLRFGQDGYRYSVDEHLAKGNLRNNASYNGALTLTNQRATESNLEALFTANRTLGGFDLTATAGGNLRRNTAVGSVFSTFGLLVEGVYNPSNSALTPAFTSNETRSGMNSVYGSVVATFRRYWTVEATARNDWSSTLPKENASYFYPSVNTSLLLSDLFPSITKNDWLSYAKVRAAYSQVGADANAYQLATTYAGAANKFGSMPQFTLANVSLNPNLKPEQTTGNEMGVELGFMNNRVTVEATRYFQRTKNQIINLTLPLSTGFTSASVNAGAMRNTGVELMLTVQPLQSKTGLNWTSTFNYSRNRNLVESLAPGLATTVLAANWSTNIEARVGHPYGVIFGYGWLRDSVSGKRMVGTDGLPIRDPVRRILGNVNPDWTGGWSNAFRFRSWALNLLFDVRSGGQNFSSGNWFGMYAGVLSSTLKGREEDWDKPGIKVDGIVRSTGQPNTTTVVAEDYYHNMFYAAEDGIFDTGYIKLRELRLAYDVPSRLLGALKLSQMNVAFVGRNLWMQTKFPNYDPENASNSGNAGQGFDFGAMPTTRSFGLNLSITP